MISNDISSTETVRNVFVIDDKGIVRVILVSPLNIGRFIPEILRIIQALQMADCSKGSTPAKRMYLNAYELDFDESLPIKEHHFKVKPLWLLED